MKITPEDCEVNIRTKLHTKQLLRDWKNILDDSVLGCEHANEVPNICKCPENCYCKKKGNTCST